jgi:hypothetical protein
MRASTRSLLLAAMLAFPAAPLAAQSVQEARIDSLQAELTRASSPATANQERLGAAQLLLNRYRNVMVPAESGVWTFVMPVENRWRAVATVPADSGWVRIVLDSAGIVRDSAAYYWVRPRK